MPAIKQREPKEERTLAMPEPWRMLRPIGDTVRWKQDVKSKIWYRAMLTNVHDDSVSVMAFPDGYHIPMPRTGVRHHTDPWLEKLPEASPAGVFELSELEQVVLELQAQVIELQRTVRKLRGEHAEFD